MQNADILRPIDVWVSPIKVMYPAPILKND